MTGEEFLQLNELARHDAAPAAEPQKTYAHGIGELAGVLGSNPAGVCVHVEELKGWLSSFDRYRRSVYRWLDVGSNDRFIRKIRHGLYEKIL